MTRITPIYEGTIEDFTWVGFGSGSGTNLRECAKVIPPRLVFTDRPRAALRNLEELATAQHMVLNGYKFCGSWKKAQGDPEAEAAYKAKSLEYNAEILRMLQGFEAENGRIDLIVLGGYMRLMQEPLLSAYQDRIINVHPADLSLLRGRERIYVGANAVYDALRAKETETRSSVILVDPGTDHGEILTQGPPVDVFDSIDGLGGGRPPLNDLADYHQIRQKEISDWPSLTAAVEMIAQGRIALGNEKFHFGEWRQVFVDGAPMTYGGYQVTK